MASAEAPRSAIPEQAIGAMARITSYLGRRYSEYHVSKNPDYIMIKCRDIQTRITLAWTDEETEILIQEDGVLDRKITLRLFDSMDNLIDRVFHE